MTGIEERLTEAIAIARVAGKKVSDISGDIHVFSKGKNDIVSDMDYLSERIIKDYLLGKFKRDAFLGEEGGYDGAKDPDGIWVVDPIDGSADFVRGIQLWTISIGYMVGDEIVLGVVYCPGTGEMFHATKGGGAFCNGRRLHVSETKDFSEAMTIVTPPIRHLELSDLFFRLIRKLFACTSDFREFGSAALHLCYVAAGKVDGFFEFMLKLHDICAGVLILSEAGGMAADVNPEDDFFKTGNIIASNKAFFDQYAELIRREWLNR